MTTKTISLPHLYSPRDYQINILNALDSDIKRVVWCIHRRGGKDLTTWNWLIKALVETKQTAFYILPTYSQAKKIIWEGMTKDGIRFLDFIPKELIKKQSVSELSIRFINDSYLQLVGSDNYDRLVGTNPRICVFSEMAIQNPQAWELIRPILAENEGIAIFISTPRGKNHFYDLYQSAKGDPDWFCEHLTVDDTQAISQDAINKERHSGMSEEMIEQEFYCSFEIGQLGSYYGRCMKLMEEEGRIGYVPYDPNLLVYTAWDIGYSDPTSIIFFQKRGNEILIIDHYENTGYGLNHYLEILRERNYNYATHYFPHDSRAHEKTYGNTYMQVAQQSEFTFSVLTDVRPIMEGIEKVRGIMPRIFIDRDACKYLIKCLLQYHCEWDDRSKVFRDRPDHDWSSHSADAFRYMAYALDLAKSRAGSLTPEKLKEMRRKAGYYP